MPKLSKMLSLKPVFCATAPQSRFTQGLSLGQLLHTVALAPGESTRIAMIDWTRRVRATGQEATTATEQLESNLERNRSLNEVVKAVASEVQTGFSHSEGSSIAGQAGLATGGAVGLDLSSLGYPIKAAGGSGESFGLGGGLSSATSTAVTTSYRNISADMAQKIRDTTHQASSSVRNR
jgi:hypothetical protein